MHEQQTLVPLQASNKTLHNRIHVFVRVKPLTLHEKLYEKNRQWQLINDKTITHSVSKESYMFDKVFNDQMSTTDIFESEAKKLVLSALDGYNVTIFAYGQTASGKTYTMRGNDQHLGVIPLSLSEIFRNLEERYGQSFTKISRDQPSQAMTQKSWIVKVSYIEIYNECVNDLLDPTRRNLNVRENQQGKANVEGLSEYEVSSLEETMFFLLKGDEQRQIAETKQNEKSSRSHTVFKINITMSEKNTQTGRNHIKTSQINLVDLAGSEGVNKTQSEGLRFREGSNINKSLLALSRVIQMLGQKYMNGAAKSYHINFRDSKLTRILQQSLQGNSMTSIICTMSQLFNNYQESRETLNFGAKAKNIKTIVNLNEIVKESPEEIALKIQKLTKENEDLKAKLLNQGELLESFERDKEEFAALGNLKSHQNYLRQLLDTKNDELLMKDEQIQSLEMKLIELNSRFDQQEARISELDLMAEQIRTQSTQIEKDKEELTKLKLNQELKIQELTNQIQQLLTQTSNNQRQDNIAIQDETMQSIYLIDQKSKLDISNSSLISNQNTNKASKTQTNFVETFNSSMQKDVLILMSENEKLKSTIKLLQQKKEECEKHLEETLVQSHDLRDQLNQEKNNNLRMLQQLRVIKIESKKKDKLISKRNFQIQGLYEKIEVLERSNTCLFKELDNTIQGCSQINNQSHLEIIDEYSREGEVSQRPSISEEQQLQQPESRQSLINQLGSNEGLTSGLLNAHHKAQLMELNTKIDILLTEKNNLERERAMLQNDLEEAEKNIESLAKDIKDQDYDFMEVLDENEEFETQYQELMIQFQKQELVVKHQKELLEQQSASLKKLESYKSDNERLKLELESREKKIKGQETLIQQLNSEIKKRKRTEFESGSSNTSLNVQNTDAFSQQERKRFKLNDGEMKVIQESLNEDDQNLNDNSSFQYQIASQLKANQYLYHQIQQQITSNSSAKELQQTNHLKPPVSTSHNLKPFDNNPNTTTLQKNHQQQPTHSFTAQGKENSVPTPSQQKKAQAITESTVTAQVNGLSAQMIQFFLGGSMGNNHHQQPVNTHHKNTVDNQQALTRNNEMINNRRGSYAFPMANDENIGYMANSKAKEQTLMTSKTLAKNAVSNQYFTNQQTPLGSKHQLQQNAAQKLPLQQQNPTVAEIMSLQMRHQYNLDRSGKFEDLNHSNLSSKSRLQRQQSSSLNNSGTSHFPTSQFQM